MKYIPILGIFWAIKSKSPYNLFTDLWQAFWIIALTYTAVGAQEFVQVSDYVCMINCITV